MNSRHMSQSHSGVYPPPLPPDSNVEQVLFYLKKAMSNRGGAQARVPKCLFELTS